MQQSLWAEQALIERYLLKHIYSIRFLILIYNFFGLAPISLENISLLKKQKPRQYSHNFMFKKSIISLMYTYACMTIMSGSAFITVPLITPGGPDSDANLLDTAAVIKGIFGLIVILVIWLTVVAHSKRALNILNKIAEMDKEMLVLQDLCYFHTSKRQISIMFAVNCLVWISIFVLEIIVVPDWYNVWPTLLIPSMIMNWYILQYVFLLVMIENRAVGVNCGFQMISEGRLATFIYSNIRPADTSERKIVNNFMILRRAHAILAGICRDITEYYSFPVLPTISFLCCATIYDCYYLILPMVVHTYYTSRLEIANMICWILMELSPVVVLAVYVTRVVKQMEKTGGIVYNVLSRAALTQVAKNELTEFSFELLHRKILFTAYDIFSLDGTLIKSIFGMLATYLIILMQFQINHLPAENLKASVNQ